MKWPVAMVYRPDNSAGDAFAQALGRHQTVVQHMRALPHGAVADALATVRAFQASVTTKRGFEFLVLTAARSGEVRFATWEEIDTAGRVWTLSAARMHGDAGSWVFTTRGGMPPDAKQFRRLLERCGIASREKRERRRARQVEPRAMKPLQRYPANAEYLRPAEAVTPSEGYLRELCDRTFLSLWSYPNPFRDQAGSDQDGKELCDLLVVFDNNIIFFSDKHCDFPDSANLDLDWARWYRRAIVKSARQLWGAERWIREHPDRVFLDSKCTKKFPLSLVPTPTTALHRVVIAHGAAARCIRELGGSGSLMLNSAIVGNDHELPREKGGVPFMVGHVDPARGYVHVLDDTTLEVLLKTLDTAADLSAYLTKKATFIDSGVALFAAGEEELLAHYLTHLNANKEYDFVFEDGVNAVTLTEGFWQDFVSSPERTSQLDANRVSYVWDGIIERFTHHFLQGTSQFLSDTTLSSHEQILRFFAREPRLR